VFVVIVGWASMIAVLFGDLENLSGTFDTLLFVLQIVGLIAFIGAVLLTAWNAWLTWRDGRKWTAKLWNTLLFGSAFMLLYVAFTFKLVALTVEY
jgi:uncharacterized membrane protein